MSKKLPKPPPAAIAEYNRLLAQHRQATEAVLKAKKEGTRNQDAQAELAKLSREFNDLIRQFDFRPHRPLQDYIDELTEPE